MTADDFLNHAEYGRQPIREIADVVKQWDQERGGKSCDDATGMSTMLAVLGIDAVIGDGLLNEVSPELLSSMTHLMSEKADSYDEARALIAEKIAAGDAAFLGFVNKIKGQIGEDRFIAEYPEYVLAASKSQEGVDAVKSIGDGLMDAVQVKMYSDPDAVIRHMLAVQSKVDQGLQVDGNIVERLSFAVPEDIADAVREKAAAHPELESIQILPIHSNAGEVANVVLDAGNHIASPMQHLGNEVLSSVGFMVALDILTNSYLVAKGKKSIGAVVEETAVKAPIGTVAILGAKSTAMVIVKTGAASNPIVAPIIVAMTVRKLAQNWYDHRLSFAGKLKSETEWMELIGTALKNKPALSTFPA